MYIIHNNFFIIYIYHHMNVLHCMHIVFTLDGTNTSSTYATTLASSTTMNTTYSS